MKLSYQGVCFFFCLLLPLSLSAQTDVPSGPLAANTSWTVSNSPYVITGDISIPEGITLTIEPGVEVLFGGTFKLLVAGELVAIGNADAPITFSHQTAGEYWRNILFADSSSDALRDGDGVYVSGSILKHVTLTAAGWSNPADPPNLQTKGVISLSNAHPEISHVTVSDNISAGIYGELLSALVRLTNVTVSYNVSNQESSCGGICLTGQLNQNSRVEINNSTISDNRADRADRADPDDTSQHFGGGIRLELIDSFVVQKNIISDNYAFSRGGGIRINYALSPGTEKRISGNTIENNESGIFDGGISLLDAEVVMENNIIRSNTALSAAGIGVNGKTQLIDLSANIIQSNQSVSMGAGLWIGGGSMTISDNIFLGNTVDDDGHGSGIDIHDGTITMNNNILAHNVVGRSSGSTSGGDGAAIKSQVAKLTTITNNTFYRNGSVNTIILTSHFDISNNTLTENAASSTLIAVNPDVAFSPTLQNNNFYNNDTLYEIGNGNISLELTAFNNWWGITDETEVAKRVLGPIATAPVLQDWNTQAPISTPVNLQAAVDNEQINVSWDANQESDLAGYFVYWGTDDNSSYPNKIDAGNVTAYVLDNAGPGDVYVTVSAYDVGYAAVNDNLDTPLVNENQTRGQESWYSEAVKTSIDANVDLQLSTSSDVTSVLQFQGWPLELNISNSGIHAATNAVLTLDFNQAIDGVEADSFSGATCSVSAQQITCPLTGINPSTTTTLTAQIIPATAGELSMTATVTLAEADRNSTDNTAGLKLEVIADANENGISDADEPAEEPDEETKDVVTDEPASPRNKKGSSSMDPLTLIVFLLAAIVAIGRRYTPASRPGQRLDR